MNALYILIQILLYFLLLILTGLLMSMVLGCIALIINERKTICCCLYCEKKKDVEEKSIKLSEIIIEPNREKKISIKN